jgi:hypothetical protein
LSSVNESRPEQRQFRGPIGLIIASLLAVVGWLVFILVYAIDWSRHSDLFQNIIVVIVSFLIAGILIGEMWIAFGVRSFWKFRE